MEWILKVSIIQNNCCRLNEYRRVFIYSIENINVQLGGRFFLLVIWDNDLVFRRKRSTKVIGNTFDDRKYVLRSKEKKPIRQTHRIYFLLIWSIDSIDWYWMNWTWVYIVDHICTRHEESPLNVSHD
jgi:hypothetical protein